MPPIAVRDRFADWSKKGLIVAQQKTKGPKAERNLSSNRRRRFASMPIRRGPSGTSSSGSEPARHDTFVLFGVTGSGKTKVYILVIAEAVITAGGPSGRPRRLADAADHRRSAAGFPGRRPAQPPDHSERHAIGGGPRGGVDVVGRARAVFAPMPSWDSSSWTRSTESAPTSRTNAALPRPGSGPVVRRRRTSRRIGIGDAGVGIVVAGDSEEEGRPPSLPHRWKYLPDAAGDHRGHSRTICGLKPAPAIGRTLEEAKIFRNSLQKQGQVILIFNIRGFLSLLWCRCGGQAVKCPQCDVTLTWHKQRGDRTGAPQLRLFHAWAGRLSELPAPAALTPWASARSGWNRRSMLCSRKTPARRMDSDTMHPGGSHDFALEASGKARCRFCSARR